MDPLLAMQLAQRLRPNVPMGPLPMMDMPSKHLPQVEPIPAQRPPEVPLAAAASLQAQPPAEVGSYPGVVEPPSPAAPQAQQGALQRPRISMGPAQQGYLDSLQTDHLPQKSEFHPSIWRKLAAATLGGLAGMHDPRLGIETAGGIVDAPYNRSLSEYQTKLAQKKSAADEEFRQQKEESLANDQESQADERGARAEQLRSKAKKQDFEITPEGLKHTLDKLKIGHPGAQPKTIGVKLPNGEELQGVVQTLDPSTGLYSYKDPSGVFIDPNIIKKSKIIHTDSQAIQRPLSPEEQHIELARKEWDANPQNAGRTFGSKDLEAINNRYAQSRETPATQASKYGQAANVNIKLEETRESHSHENLSFLADQIKKNPQIIHDPSFAGGDKIASAKAQRMYVEQSGQALPKKLTPRQQQTVEAADMSLGMADHLEKLLKHPAAKSSLGPTLGRLGEAEAWLGSDLARLSPEEQKVGQELRSVMKYLLFAEGRNVTGGVARTQIIKELKRESPNVKMIEGFLQGSIAAIRANANVNKSEIHHTEFGGGTAAPKTAGDLKAKYGIK